MKGEGKVECAGVGAYRFCSHKFTFCSMIVGHYDDTGQFYCLPKATTLIHRIWFNWEYDINDVNDCESMLKWV